MSTTYPDLTETSFPENIDVFNRMSDVTHSDISLVSQYQAYVLANNMSAAAKILDDNPLLANKIINAAVINKFLDAVIAVQRFFKSDVHEYIENKSDELSSQIGEFQTKGAYSSSKAYKQYNIVTKNGNCYVCLKDCIGKDVSNTEYWVKISSKGEQGVSGIGLSFCGTYDSSHVYSKDDCVTDGTTVYVAVQASTGKPLTDTKYWNILISNTEKENKHKSELITLLASEWVNNIQTVSVNGVTTNNDIIISPNSDSIASYTKFGIYCTMQTSGNLSFSCNKEPTENIKVNVVILGG